MTTTETKTTRAQERERTREGRFLNRVATAHHRGGTSAIRRWRVGAIDTDMIALTQDATASEYPVWALTAKLFVLSTRESAAFWFGYPGSGIGSWMRAALPWTGKPKAPDPRIRRALGAITRTESIHEIDRALTAVATLSRDSVPDWEAVIAELALWSNPAHRAQVRFTWARDFHTQPPKQTKDSKQTRP